MMKADLMQAAMYVMNNPDVERDVVRNNPQMREIVDGNPDYLHNLINDPSIDPEIRETLANPQLFHEMISNLRASPNPATTGGALGGAVGTAIALKPTVTLKVRVLNGPSFAVKASLEATVDLFKFVLGKSCDVPAGEQRVVFNGRILYEDENTLKSYGLKEDDTLHVVRGSGGLS
ncbi:uncharacterized protein [Rutidosis leptorrhynchoides]|uniref:uncharacterized protein isoform X2 n=1 Tax=Rutidosis leptorrhynchoides TaxID=125765 RepID=UPI003A992EC0